MNQDQFKLILRNAVLLAIPLSVQSGCMSSEPVKADDLIKINDPCRKGETTRKSDTESYSAQIAHIDKPLNAEQCIALCKDTFEKYRIGGTSNLYKLEKISASNCKTENLPYTHLVPGPRIDKPSTRISCEITYTAIDSPYTCPRPVPGRMPNGLRTDAAEQSAQNSIAEYLANMRAMEAAAVTAFKYLTRELEAYGAPQALIDRAKQAVTEEQRHAEMADLLAAAHQAELVNVAVDDFVLRSLYEIALENAIEGCVNETFAAACGIWQSEHAELPAFKEVIAHITDEEMGHAALSWEIHEWLMPQLSLAQQHQIRESQSLAIDELINNFRQKGDPAQQFAFGLPDEQAAGYIFAQLQNSVWQSVPSIH